LVSVAESVPAGSRGLLVPPYFAGERNPIFDPNARGCIAGLTLSHSRALLSRQPAYPPTTGARDVTMADIAVAAGIGRATLYRRYPDVASIATALLDEHERALQEELMRGSPPLGPGAPPAERLGAFYGAMADLLETHYELVLATEIGQSRFGTGAYGFWRAHVRSLLVG
jgi:AcrR family transcriptional regulator